MAGVISKLVSFFDLSRGLNALGVYKNLNTGGQPDSKLFQDLLATTFLKKYDNTDFQDVATHDNLIDRTSNKVITPENMPVFTGSAVTEIEPDVDHPYYRYTIEGGEIPTYNLTQQSSGSSTYDVTITGITDRTELPDQYYIILDAVDAFPLGYSIAIYINGSFYEDIYKGLNPEKFQEAPQADFKYLVTKLGDDSYLTITPNYSDALFDANGGLLPLTKLEANANSTPLVLTSVNGVNSFQPPQVLGELLYYYTSTVSDVASSYKQTLDAVVSGSTLTFAGLVHNQLITKFYTESNNPNRLSIPAGTYRSHLHAYKSAGTKNLAFRVEVWEVDSAGVDVAKICDIGSSDILGGSLSENVTATSISTEYTLASKTSRLCHKYYAVVTSGGSAPTMVIAFGGGNDSHSNLPAPIVDASNFVPYVGMSSDLDTGTKDIIYGNATPETPSWFDATKKFVSATYESFGAWFNLASNKTTPVDADKINYLDSTTSFGIVKITLLNLWTNYLSPKVSTSISGKADITYVDTQDAATLASAEAYADSLVVGLLDDRGNYNPSTNSNQYPTTGGSGVSGAIKKGDLWSINGLGSGVSASIGGKTVTDGDVIRALVDIPSQTDTNWNITENNFGYVAENLNNKTNTITGNESSTTLYASVKGFVDYLVGMTWLTNSIFGTWINGQSAKTTLVDADSTLVSDSEDGNKSKKVSWLNLWENYLKIKADALYLKLSGGTLTGALNEATIVDVASASTINLTGINANTINITGTTTIATITGVTGGGIRRFIFNGTLTIGHNTSTILCPNNTNLVVNAGDVVDFVLTTTGALKVINYAPFVPIILKDGTSGGYYSNYPINIGGFNSDAFINLFGQANNDATKPVQIGRKSATTSGKTVMKFAGTNGGGANGLWMSLFDSAYSANPRYFNVWNCDGGGVIIGATTGSNNVNDVNQTLQVFKSGVKIADNSGVEATVTAPSRAVLQLDSTSKGFQPPRMTTTLRDAVSWNNTTDKGMQIYNTTTDKLQCWNGTTWNDLF